MTLKLIRPESRGASGSSPGRLAHLSLFCDAHTPLIASSLVGIFATLVDVSQIVAASEIPRFAQAENVCSLCQDARWTRLLGFRILLAGHFDESRGHARLKRPLSELCK